MTESDGFRKKRFASQTAKGDAQRLKQDGGRNHYDYSPRRLTAECTAVTPKPSPGKDMEP